MSEAHRIIVAVDVPTLDEAKGLVDLLGPLGVKFKFGLELISAVGAPALAGLGGSAFFDVKFHDIANTVAGATRSIMLHKPWMFNVHCKGGKAMMQAAVSAANEEMLKKSLDRRPVVIGVTELTSMNKESLAETGTVVEDLTAQVVRLAVLAFNSSLDGVVASPQETSAIREAVPCEFLIVNPGIRPKWSAKNDQERITTPYDAIRADADYLVIGRPITKNDIGGPVEAVKRITEEIDQALNRAV